MKATKNLREMHDDARSMFDSAVRAANPHDIVQKCLKLQPHASQPNSHQLSIHTPAHSSSYTLASAPSSQSFTSILLLGVGKASVPMVAAAHQLLSSSSYLADTLVITKRGHTPQPPPPFKVVESSHPIPDNSTYSATQQLLDQLSSHATPSTLILLMLSGGASSLLEKPVDGVAEADITALYRSLVNSGADITEINAVRCLVSAVKGGRLWRRWRHCQWVTLVLSDVVGDDLRVIGSAPTVRQRRDRAHCRAIVQKYNMTLPQVVMKAMDEAGNGKDEDELRDEQDDRQPVNVIAGSSLLSVQAAHAEAVKRGYNSLVLTDRLTGDVDSVYRLYTAIAGSIHTSGTPLAPPAAIITGGETTVHIPATALHAHGGRNQHMALLAVPALAAMGSGGGGSSSSAGGSGGGGDVVLLCGGTDGTDGPTDATGAIVCNETAQWAQHCDVVWEEHVRQFDSYGFFQQLDSKRDKEQHGTESHLKIGATGTNVADVSILLVRSSAAAAAEHFNDTRCPL